MKDEDQLRKQIKQVPMPPQVGSLRGRQYNLQTEPVYREPTVGDTRSGYRLKEVPSPHTEEELNAEAFRQVAPVQPAKGPKDEDYELTEPEYRKVGATDIQEENKKEVEGIIRTLRHRGVYLAGFGIEFGALEIARQLVSTSSFSHTLIEGIVTAATIPVTIIGLNKLGDYLDHPSVKEFLSRPSEEQLRELDRLPTNQRVEVGDALGKMRVVAAKKRWPFSRKLVTWLAANHAAKAGAQ